MKLYIDPRGGMAGDMFTAALISAGADFEKVRAAMLAAGKKLGTADIRQKQAPDGATQLSIRLESKRHHLGGNEARRILTELFEQFDIRENYRRLGERILEVLIKAEIRAHAEFNIVVEGDPGHSHGRHHHDHDGDGHHHHHDHEHDHGHGHHHHHSHDHEEEAFLHEAQDIVMDIMGAVMGLQLLEAETHATLTAPVSVGGGQVVCSHGTLDIPAPATTIILQEYGLAWNKGPVEVELFTPTGAAILAGLDSKLDEGAPAQAPSSAVTGSARGGKLLDIPPLKVFLLS